MQIESKPHQGTSILLFLPRAKGDASVLREPALTAPRATPRCKVLLVEDDASVAALTGEMLLELGYQVMHVASARQGLQALALQRDTIGLILSDVMMPGGMDGLSFVRALRKDGVQLPVVLVSGYAEAVRREAGKAGITLLAKPYRLDDLGRVLSGVLVRRDAPLRTLPVNQHDEPQADYPLMS